MKKICKLLHINDGSAETLVNGNFHFMEEYGWAEEVLNGYLAQGYEVRQMIPVVTPAALREGSFGFYRSGFTVYLEKEVPQGEAPGDDDLDEMDFDGFDEEE